MAIVVETRIPEASREAADRFDADIEAAMREGGGPPAGLMVHLARPDGDGFLLVNVWRNEADLRAFWDVIASRLGEAGLAFDEPTISPVWSFARP